MELRLLRQGNVIGKSAALKNLREQIEGAAKSELPVLICGEVGTGTEFVAEEIHNLSPRRWKPFVSVSPSRESIASVTNDWFGPKIDKIKEAKGGTLFLDEISNADMRTQSTLLRALETENLSPFDDEQSAPCDARIIAATSLSLEDAVERECFDVDLLRRLEAIRVDVPSLRARQEDIPLLVDFFLRFIRKEYRLEVEGITLDAMDCLLAHPWPGNIRELKNTIIHAAVCLGTGTIGVKSLPERFSRVVALPMGPRGFARISPNLLGFNGKDTIRVKEPHSNILVLRKTADGNAYSDASQEAVRPAANGRIGRLLRKRASAVLAITRGKTN